ncbi:MAG TPA: DUF234 domain-containing protein [Thermotogota bacterium]|nr:DUF234 domain-containing protein [Thermotogota bacterium]HRW94188.1 DUF234 domain-containing protein [Thermotogota bacterium]
MKYIDGSVKPFGIWDRLLPGLHNAEVLPVLPDRVGKNWGKVPGTKDQPYEIDILGETASELLVMECKWQNRPVNPSVGQALLQKGEYLQDPRKKVYAIASKSGFERGMDERVIQVGLPEMEWALRLAKKIRNRGVSSIPVAERLFVQVRS